eukprot:4416176-Alexandrium_andersonii.AAC.1
MLEEHGYAANCLKCTRVRTQRPAAGARHSEERLARFEAILRANDNPSMARADRCVNECLADQARENVESAPAPAASSSSGGALVHGRLPEHRRRWARQGRRQARAGLRARAPPRLVRRTRRATACPTPSRPSLSRTPRTSMRRCSSS